MGKTLATRCDFDSHTATRPHPAALEQMLLFYQEWWSRVDAPHQMGQDVERAITPFMEMLRDSLGARVDDVFHFYSSGADAVEAVLMTHYFEWVRETGKNHILTTNIEEAAPLMCLKRLEKLGCVEKMIPVNAHSQVTRALLEERLSPRTSLVSLSWANGLTGVIHPIADLAEACRAAGVRIHVDASYVIGKLFFRFDDLPIDYLTFDGRLIHSPQGTGGALVNSQVKFPQTEMHAPGTAALATALKENERFFDHLNLETARLRDDFERRIIEEIPEAVVFFSQVERLPNCSAIGFPGAMGEALLYLLHRNGVYATLGGGHCQKLSHVLITSGVDQELAQCALSFSFSYETTQEQVDYAIKTVISCVRQLQAASASLLQEV